jgi:hypothetical protein
MSRVNEVEAGFAFVGKLVQNSSQAKMRRRQHSLIESSKYISVANFIFYFIRIKFIKTILREDIIFT